MPPFRGGVFEGERREALRPRRPVPPLVETLLCVSGAGLEPPSSESARSRVSHRRLRVLDVIQ